VQNDCETGEQSLVRLKPSQQTVSLCDGLFRTSQNVIEMPITFRSKCHSLNADSGPIWQMIVKLADNDLFGDTRFLRSKQSPFVTGFSESHRMRFWYCEQR
jgi:hypothetical protein